MIGFFKVEMGDTDQVRKLGENALKTIKFYTDVRRCHYYHHKTSGLGSYIMYGGFKEEYG